MTKCKILAHSGIQTRDLPLTTRATTELRRLMSTEWIKVHLVFTCAIFRNLPVALCRCSKIKCRELHFVNSLLSANVLIGKHQNDTHIR